MKFFSLYFLQGIIILVVEFAKVVAAVVWVTDDLIVVGEVYVILIVDGYLIVVEDAFVIIVGKACVIVPVDVTIVET